MWYLREVSAVSTTNTHQEGEVKLWWGMDWHGNNGKNWQLGKITLLPLWATKQICWSYSRDRVAQNWKNAWAMGIISLNLILIYVLSRCGSLANYNERGDTFSPDFISVEGRTLPFRTRSPFWIVIPLTLLAPSLISTLGRTKTENSSDWAVFAKAAICTISSSSRFSPVVSRSKKTRRGYIAVKASHH